MDPTSMIKLPIQAPDVTRIMAIADPVLRNLWITQSYADFSARLHAAIDGVDHTWCGFAVWASATAGQSIRREELPRIIVELLAASHHQEAMATVNRRARPLRAVKAVKAFTIEHVLQTFDGAVDTVAERIAHGNTLVFAELAPLFVAFLELAEHDAAALTPARLNPALDHVATVPIEPDLRAAFDLYRRAVTEPDQGERARSLLAANVLAVAHEQQRLQDDIEAAIDAGLISAEQLVAEWAPNWVPERVIKLLTGPVRKPIEALLDRLWDETATELLMTLRVPGAALRLSHTLPDLPDGLLFPAALADLGTGPAADAYGRWDRTGGTGRNDGARDWVDRNQRMSYIVNLFRSRQQDQTLVAPPFVVAQLDDMRRGLVPPPPLLPASHPPRPAADGAVV